MVRDSRARQSAANARKGIVEPVIGQIKHARGFRQFLFRGFVKVEGERSLVCTTHNGAIAGHPDPCCGRVTQGGEIIMAITRTGS